MMRGIIFFVVLLTAWYSKAQETSDKIYLIPGQGADCRLFDNIDLGSNYCLECLEHVMPERGASMTDYALEFLNRIDTTDSFIVIGVSLGGMLATEISELSTPNKVILISSAKSNQELPWRYKFQKHIPIYKLVSGKLSKRGALILQPIVEPDRNTQEEVFVSMLENKHPDFFKRTISMIMEWDRVDYSNDIIHIHGEGDHTIPIRNVSYDYLIEKGSHMMTLTKGGEISEVILQALSDG